MLKPDFKCCVLLIFLTGMHSHSYEQPKDTTLLRHQADSLKGILKTMPDDSNKADVLKFIYDKLSELEEYDSALAYNVRSQALAEKIGYTTNLPSGLNGVGNLYFQLGDFSRSLEYYYKALSISQQVNSIKYLTAAIGNLGNVYSKLGNYPKALEYDLKALKISQQQEDGKSISTNFCNIAIVYYEQGNYSKALEYDFKALKVAQQINSQYLVSNCYDNLGVVYAKLKNYKNSLYYQFKSLEIDTNRRNWDGISDNYINIGDVYAEQKDFTKAQVYYFKALDVLQRIQDKDAVANLFGKMGEVYTKLKDYIRARIFLDSSLALSKKVGDKKYTENAYRSLALLDSALGNYKGAYVNYGSYVVYRDSLINQESVTQITQMEISNRYEKREDSIKSVHEKADIIKTAEIKRKNIITYSSIVIAVLAILIAIQLIHSQQVKRKKDKIIFETERQRMEAVLANDKTLLDEYVKNLVEKNNMLDQFKTDLELMKNIQVKEEMDEKRIEQLEYLNNATILTEDDWNKFKELFEQVHKGFFIRLKERLPNLTQAETRLLCLTKLELDTRHMAAIIGVSFNTIEQTRYRLRKKLNLSKEDSLSAIIASI